MKEQHGKQVTTIMSPEARGGSSVDVVTSERKEGGTQMQRDASEYIKQVLDSLHGDENFAIVSNRLQGFTEASEAMLHGLRSAVADGKGEEVARHAHDITDHCGRFGAISMMKLGIALQMIGRCGLMDRAQDLLQELETEYKRFKSGLLYKAV